MKRVTIVKAYCKPPFLLESKDDDNRYLEEFIRLTADINSYPNTLLDLNYAETHLDADNHTRVVYVDLPFEAIKSVNEAFERVTTRIDELISDILIGFGLKSEEVRPWRDCQMLNRVAVRDLELSFGSWKIFQSPFDFCDSSNTLDEELCQRDFLKWLLEHHGKNLFAIKDWCLLSREKFNGIDEFCDYLNRFSTFPVKYFHQICASHGWKFTGLSFGELCTDGETIISMSDEGKLYTIRLV